jgi:hypothetical protein
LRRGMAHVAVSATIVLRAAQEEPRPCSFLLRETGTQSAGWGCLRRGPSDLMGPLMAKMVRRSKSDIVSQLRKTSCQTRNLKRLIAAEKRLACLHRPAFFVVPIMRCCGAAPVNLDTECGGSKPITGTVPLANRAPNHVSQGERRRENWVGALSVNRNW